MWRRIVGFALVSVSYHLRPRHLLYCRVISTVSENLRCSQRWSTLLRPERNSLVERLKQTRKRMLHHICRTNPKQWHKLRPIVLWCIRESNTWCYLPPLLNGRCTSLLRAVVSEMSYTVLSGTLNSSIPYHSTHDDNTSSATRGRIAESQNFSRQTCWRTTHLQQLSDIDWWILAKSKKNNLSPIISSNNLSAFISKSTHIYKF